VSVVVVVGGGGGAAVAMNALSETVALMTFAPPPAPFVGIAAPLENVIPSTE
jgi:hypothetical protein